jgi:hypothetical protein
VGSSLFGLLLIVLTVLRSSWEPAPAYTPSEQPKVVDAKLVDV